MRPALLVLTAVATLATGSAASQPGPAPTQATASAFLNITPKRITFDRNRRNGTVFVLNQGAAPVTVDIGLVDRVMLRDGRIVSVDEAGKLPEGQAVAAQLRSARELVQVSPRRVTLQPGRGQTVRLRLSSLPQAADEFRSHLTVTTIPPRDAGTTAEAAAAGGSDQLSFQITAVYGLSIPVIVRPAQAEAAAAIEGARVEVSERRAAILALDLVRTGPSSVYGNFEVRTAGGRRDAEPLGVARGVGVYPEIGRRLVRIPLSRAPNPGERLEVTFTDDDTSPGKVLAKAAL